MTTFPNTVLLRGPRTILVDPGLPLQNEPVLRALEARGLSAADVDLVVLTHAHLDHAGGCADVMAPVVVHELETTAPYWPLVGGLLERLPLERLTGDGGELAPGVGLGAHAGALRRAHQPGRRDGGGARPCSAATRSVPGREEFDAMAPTGSAAETTLASWTAHPRLGSGADRRRAPAAVRPVSRPRRASATALCYTRAPVTAPGRLLACLSTNTSAMTAEPPSRPSRR